MSGPGGRLCPLWPGRNKLPAGVASGAPASLLNVEKQQMTALPVDPAPEGKPAARHGGCPSRDSWLKWLIGAPSLHEFFDVEGWTRMTAKEKASYVRNEVALGITICFAQIPESVAFAFMAHVKPPVAIHAAWVVGLICSVLGGRPGMVSGAEGAFAAIVATLIPEPAAPGGNGAGVELLFPSVMVCGALMLLVWLTGGYRFISLVPASVMLGFCNGLAIVIGLSQLHPFKEGQGEHKHWVGGSRLWCMAAEMSIAMLVMEFVPKIPHKAARVLPSSLLAIFSAVFIEFCLVRGVAGAKTPVIGEVEKFTLTYPYPFFLDGDYDMSLLRAGDAGKILAQGALLAIAGIVQGLLTTEVVYDFLKTPTNASAVCLSCGVANIVSGFLGGMGGDAMIGLSTINCLNGGRGRLGPTVTALGIAACMFGAYPLLNFIPVAALAGVMIVVVLHTFKWFSVPMVAAAALPASLRKPLRLPERVDRWDMLIVAVVTALVVALNLVYAVGVGLVMASLRYAWETARELDIEDAWQDGAKVYFVRGRLFFGTSMRFHTHFDYAEDPEEVTIALDAAPADYSASTALAKVEAMYRRQGKRASITFGTPGFVRASPYEEAASPGGERV